MIRERTGRRWAAAAMVGALVAMAPVSAHASTSAEGSWWWDTYDVGSVHAEGWTGEGVKVAMIDTWINPDVPVFEGTKLTVAEPALCGDPVGTSVNTEPVFGSQHGTTLAAMVIGNGTGAGGIRGIAPGADLTFYSWGAEEACAPPTEGRADLSAFAWGVQRAIDDGADIITTSVSTGLSESDADVVANAIAKGVVVIAATSNPGWTFGGGGDTAPAHLNGVVAATAVDSSGNLQVDDNNVTTEEDDTAFVESDTTVVAAGANLPTVGVEGDWNTAGLGTGSSMSAPLVAGMLAVVAQRYPDATGNQLIQSLIRNTGVEPHELERSDQGYGYGAAWLTSMLAVDPTQYPDENPLMDKSLGEPTAEQVDEAAARGSALPEFVSSFSQYEDAPNDPGQAAESPDPLTPILTVVLIVLGVVVLGAVVTIIIVISRKRRTPQEGTP